METLGQAMVAQSDRPWLYPNVDSAIITLWPLVKKYNWTYRDLMQAVREATSASVPDSAPDTSHSLSCKATSALPDSALRTSQSAFKYPCDREQDFATYCTNVLGLRKMVKGVSATNGHPKGHEIAKRLFTKSD
jgi:hypothetical protein